MGTENKRQSKTNVSRNTFGVRARAIAAKALGRPLPAGVEVHHVNGDWQDNSPSNLVICPNHKYHMLLHARQRTQDLTGAAESKLTAALGKAMLTKRDREEKYKAIEKIRTTRASNVRLLRDQAGGWTQLAKLTGMRDSFLIAIAGENPARNIGEVLARDIERMLRKPPGWLDHDQKNRNY